MAIGVQQDRLGTTHLPSLPPWYVPSPLSLTRIEPSYAGLFIVRKAFLLSGLMLPLIMGTIYTTYSINRTYRHLSRFVNLSQACEVSHGTAEDIVKLRRGHPVTRSQTHLNRGRYGHNDEGVYVVGKVRPLSSQCD